MPLNILISRTDNLGDIVYCLPMVSLIKEKYPQTTVSFLARDYAKHLIECDEQVDGFISWDHLKQLSPARLKEILTPFDVIIHAHTNQQIAKIAYQAKIKTRIGTTGRWYHWLYCNRLVFLSRARSDEHEIQLNAKLLKPLNIRTHFDSKQLQSKIHLNANKAEDVSAYLSSEKFNLIIHPSSNGNGREWPSEKYIELITQLKESNCHIILSGSPSDNNKTQSIKQACPWVVDIVGKTSLRELLALIEKADGLIAAGTGPLHIASSMKKRTLGLFPTKKNINPIRWAPLGEQASYITATHPDCQRKCNNNLCPCMQEINVTQVIDEIKEWF